MIVVVARCPQLLSATQLLDHLIEKVVAGSALATKHSTHFFDMAGLIMPSTISLTPPVLRGFRDPHPAPSLSTLAA